MTLSSSPTDLMRLSTPNVDRIDVTRPWRDGVGVRETSRLISRLRHRQFGVLVTTSHLDNQACKEIREDGRPVVVLAGRDITDILKKSGLNSTTGLRR